MTNSRVISISNDFFWNVIFRVTFEIFLQVWFSSVYNTYNIKWKHWVDVYSNLLSFLWLLAFLTFFLSLLMISIVYVNNEGLENIKTSKVSMLMRDFNIEKKYVIFDHTFFILRRFFLIILLAFSWNHGTVQNILFSISWVLILIWKFLSRPFESKALNFQEIVFELFLTIIMFIYFRFMNQETEFTKRGDPHVLGIIWIVLIFIMVILNIMISIKIWINKFKEQKKVKQNIIHVIPCDDSSKNVR